MMGYLSNRREDPKVIASGTELWSGYKLICEQYPNEFPWDTDKNGNYIIKDKDEYAYSFSDIKESQILTDIRSLSPLDQGWVLDFIETVEPKYRQIIYYIYYDMKTKTEVAELLNISRPTLYKYILVISGLMVDYASKRISKNKMKN